MGLGLECIPEEDEKVELAARDHRPDLLIATEGTALKLHDRKIQFAREQGACRAGRVQLVIGERVAVEPRPLQQIGFLVVVRDERDPLRCRPSAAQGALLPDMTSICRPRHYVRQITAGLSPCKGDVNHWLACGARLELPQLVDRRVEHGERGRRELLTDHIRSGVLGNERKHGPMGVSSDNYSFPYIARWSDGNTQSLKETAERVVNCAASILGGLEASV